MFLDNISNRSNISIEYSILDYMNILEEMHNNDLAMIRLEHHAIINEDMILLEAGIKDYIDKIIQFIKKMINWVKNIIDSAIEKVMSWLGYVKKNNLEDKLKKAEAEAQAANKNFQHQLKLRRQNDEEIQQLKEKIMNLNKKIKDLSQQDYVSQKEREKAASEINDLKAKIKAYQTQISDLNKTLEKKKERHEQLLKKQGSLRQQLATFQIRISLPSWSKVEKVFTRALTVISEDSEYVKDSEKFKNEINDIRETMKKYRTSESQSMMYDRSELQRLINLNGIPSGPTLNKMKKTIIAHLNLYEKELIREDFDLLL